jgi:signal transduction histidine kinase
MWMAWFAAGCAAGVGAAAVAGRAVARRMVRRTLAAERRARSAERLAELGSMSRGLAHEIKNPLSTIGLNAQLLSEGIREVVEAEADRARLTRRVEALGRETERLKGILEDFLEYAGELKLDRRVQDVRGVVDDLVEFFTPQAHAARVRVRADLAGEALEASVDAGHLKQALLNLMLNAVQAMGGVEEGRRELIVRARAHRDEDGADCVAVHVIDTGPGIGADALGRVFEPYFTTKATGTGLGLPTARRIVEAHGGRMMVHSEVGKGTDFAVLLPAAGQPQVPRRSARV